jgi:hypothetical protein
MTDEETIAMLQQKLRAKAFLEQFRKKFAQETSPALLTATWYFELDNPEFYALFQLELHNMTNWTWAMLLDHAEDMLDFGIRVMRYHEAACDRFTRGWHTAYVNSYKQCSTSIQLMTKGKLKPKQGSDAVQTEADEHEQICETPDTIQRQHTGDTRLWVRERYNNQLWHWYRDGHFKPAACDHTPIADASYVSEYMEKNACNYCASRWLEYQDEKAREA